MKGVDSLRQQGCGHKCRHQPRSAHAYLPNESALKMDGAILRYRYSTISFNLISWWVRGRRASGEAEVRTKVELALVQILVVVAIIQMRTLKAEVEKGSMTTAIGHGWLGPKGERKRFYCWIIQRSPKGNGVHILQAGISRSVATLVTSVTSVPVPRRVIFSF